MQLNKIKAILSVLVQNNKNLILKARYKYMEKFDLNSMKKIDDVDDYMKTVPNKEFERSTSQIEKQIGLPSYSNSVNNWDFKVQDGESSSDDDDDPRDQNLVKSFGFEGG